MAFALLVVPRLSFWLQPRQCARCFSAQNAFPPTVSLCIHSSPIGQMTRLL